MSALQLTQEKNWYDNILPAYDNGNPTYLDGDNNLIEGVYSGLENDVYHSLDAFSSSLIKELVKNTPAHVFRKYMSDISRKRTLQLQRTLDTGTLGHELTLEPEGYKNRYFRVPVAAEYPDALHTAAQLAAKCKEHALKTTGTKADLIARLKEANIAVVIFESLIEELLKSEAGEIAVAIAYTEVDAKNASSLIRAFDLAEVKKLAKKQPVDGVVWDDAMRILNTFSKHSRAPRLISNGFAELTVIARCPMTGLMLKCKFDYINKLAIASDVKTTRSACPIKFGYQCKELRYDIQEAYYVYVANLANIPVELFAFISIEYLEADICEVFELNKRRKLTAKKEMHEALRVLSECLETNEWHGYSKNGEIMVIGW